MYTFTNIVTSAVIGVPAFEHELLAELFSDPEWVELRYEPTEKQWDEHYEALLDALY